MNETFLLSNIAPQVGEGFNRHCKTPFELISLSAVLECVPDWAYLEDWCRRLTSTFEDVYVFTIPLYLPKLEADGKWRVVSVLRTHAEFALNPCADARINRESSQRISANAFRQGCTGYAPILAFDTIHCRGLDGGIRSTECHNPRRSTPGELCDTWYDSLIKYNVLP